MSNEIVKAKTSSIKEISVNEFNAKHTVDILNEAMIKITEQKLTAENINAACNCAGRIVDILKCNLDYKKFNRSIQK